jgi:RHS repeat-associated protein
LLLLFASREFDAETGLYFNRARYLDPTTGRWTTQDPLGFAAGDANLYRYVGNTPTLLVDPSGNIWYPGKYTIQYIREWRRGRELDAQLDELQRRRHDPLAAVMQAGSRPWSIHNTYAIADPAFDRNWRQGMGDAAVLAAVGANWLAAGTTWVSPAGQQLVWQGGRWWNRTANRAATAQEAAAANQAVAAARAAAAPRITFGHGVRHLEGSGLSQAAVESAIEVAVRATSNATSHWGWVQVNGQWIQYRAFVLPDGTIHIGTYFRVPANLSNARVP